MTISSGIVFSCRNLGLNFLSLKDDTSRHALTSTNCVRVQSPFGDAVKFNGTTAFLATGNLLFSVNTIESWFKPNSIAVEPPEPVPEERISK